MHALSPAIATAQSAWRAAIQPQRRAAAGRGRPALAGTRLPIPIETPASAPAVCADEFVLSDR